MIYTEKQIELLSLALMGDKTASKRLAKGSKNLSTLESALRGEVEGVKMLFTLDKMLSAFDDAVGGNKSALRLLIEMKEFSWAAVANYINGDDHALEWLKKQKLGHFIKLIHGIQEMHKHDSDKNVSIFFTP